MKHTNVLTGAKAFIAFMLLTFLAAPAFARKIYITKGSDNGVYLNGQSFTHAPGDTLVLRASTNPFSYFSLENFNGTAAAPLVVINEGGQVQVSAMAVRHCTYMKFTGSGAAGVQYGFYMTSPNQSTLAPAMGISGRSANIEVERLDIYDHGYGFWVKEEGSCDPTLQFPNWRLNNISIHDCRMRNLKQEGIYAGSTAPNGERVVYCNGAPTYPLPIRLGNVRIYNNIIDRTGRGGIQLASCDFGNNEIYGNTVTNSGTEYSPSQGNGIVLGGYTTAYVHDNTVDNTFSTGIFSLGAGEVRIENNRVDHSGSLDGRNANGSASVMIDTRLTSPVMLTKFYVKNNVLGANSDYGIRVYDTYPTYALGNVICNNTTLTGGTATSYIQGATNWFNCTAPQNQSPTANAGPLQTITLPATLTLSGSGSDLDGTIVAYQWAQLVGPSNVNFATPNAASTTVGNLVPGNYTFKLTVTDNGGATGTANVTITVNAAGTGGGGSTTGSTIKIEAENYSGMFGIQTESCSEGTQNVGWQDNDDWMDYSVNLPSAGTYTASFRVATMFTGAQFQLRNSGGSVLATVTAPNTGAFQTWTTVTATVTLPAGQQTLRIYTTNAAGGWNINWWQLQGGTGTGTPTNQTPVVNAGGPQTLTLPTSSVNLTGSATDDGTIQTYTWSQVSGPAGAVFSSIYATSTTVSNLVAGTYVFRLSAKDDGGLTGMGDVTITVNPAATTPPATSATIKIEAENYTAQNGIQTESCSEGTQNVGWQDNGDWMDYSVNLPSAGNYALGFRVATMFTGATFQLRKADGTVLATVTVPNTGSFQTWTTVNATATLPAGQQTLRIYTTNAAGGWNINWWQLAGGSSTATANQPPTVNAGTAQTITLPTATATLTGSATDSDGTIASYQWSQVSGPNNATFGSATSATTTVSNLVAGTYTFKLTATDNGGATGSANVTITVNAAPVASTTQRIEAENFTAMFGIQTEACSEGTQNVAWQDNGDWMDYSVNVASAGTYTMNFRVATEKNNPQFQVRNAAGSVLATVTVPRTGSFQTWQTISAQVSLPAGQQTLRIYTNRANGGWNFNWFEIVGGGGTTVQPSALEAEVLSETATLSVFPNPVVDRFALKLTNDLTGNLQVQFFNTSGTAVKSFTLKKTAKGTLQTYLSLAGLPAGTYVLKATMGDWTESIRVVKQ